MMRVLPALACAVVLIFATGAARADLRGDLMACKRIADADARLACFDELALTAEINDNGPLDKTERRDLEKALQREFRFDPGLKTGAFSFRIAVSGDLQISRSTAAARAVERLVRRIAKAFGDFDAWGVDVTAHGASVALSRGHPYNGDELADQAETGLKRSGLASDRYTVEVGPEAQPDLWDDGRVRDANEHIDVKITGVQ